MLEGAHKHKVIVNFFFIIKQNVDFIQQCNSRFIHKSAFVQEMTNVLTRIILTAALLVLTFKLM